MAYCRPGAARFICYISAIALEVTGLLNPLATNKAKFGLDLKKNGAVLTGTYNEKGGSTNISGRVDGKQISFGYEYSDGGGRKYTGSINGRGEISGQWNQKNASGTWKMVRRTSPLEPSKATAPAQQLDCKVFPRVYFTVASPYKGGCKDGLAEGQGSYAESYGAYLAIVNGEFHNGVLHGNAIITFNVDGERSRVEGQYRYGSEWNTITRVGDDKSVKAAIEYRNGVLFAICTTDGQEEQNCTDRNMLLGAPPASE